MPLCDECGLRFEAARSNKKYCSAACKQSAYIRRVFNEREPENEKRIKTDPDLRSDFYGRLDDLHRSTGRSDIPLNVTDDIRDSNSDDNNAKDVTVNDDKQNVSDANNDVFGRHAFTVSDGNDAKHMTENDGKNTSSSSYNPYSNSHPLDNWEYSDRKRRFHQRAEERAANKRSESGKHTDHRDPKHGKLPEVLPAMIDNGRENQMISRIPEMDDASEHYQCIVPEFFKMLALETEQRKQHVEWFAKQSDLYYAGKVNVKLAIILCKEIQLSWNEPMLIEYKEVFELLKELQDDFSFESLPHDYPYRERINTSCQNLEDLFGQGRVKRQPITVPENVQVEFYCILHELAAVTSSDSY